MKPTILLACAVTVSSILLVEAEAQTDTPKQPAQPSRALAHGYRGAFVCEKQPRASDILHVPADLVIRDNDVQFARPLFNLSGARVIGSELGSGSVDDNGAVRVSSTWSVRGIVVRGEYSGKLNSDGGALSGTQSWRGPGGEPQHRACQLALVSTTPEAR